MSADYKVIANINPAINRPVWTEPLYQWDHGITLEITGAEIPTDTPVAFSNQEDYGTALRMVSTTTGGVTSVKIPDTLLGEQIMCMGDFRVHAWVTVTNSDSAETIYHIIIPVHARPKPADYTDPGTEDPFADAIEQMQSLANQAQTSATNAAASEQAAEQAEQGAQEALEETQAIANTIQQQITTAGQNQIDAIEQAGADQIEDIQNASIDQAEKIAIKPETEGNPISVTDSAEWRFQDFEADGWTEQTVTEGNQLITFPYHSAASEYSGINISVNDDGSITANGTSAGGDNFYLNTNHKLLPGTYTLSANLQGTSGAELLIYDGASVLARGNSTFSISEEKTVEIYINWGTEGININGTYYPMLNYGSDALPYEPYSGGYQSPRPEIPSKNLLDYSKINSITSRGITFTNNNDGTFTVNGTATSQAYTAPILIDLEPGTYYVSDNFNNGPNKPRLIVEKREVGSSSGPTYASNNTVTITDTDEVKAYINVANGSTLDNEIVYPMIEKNSIKTSWEPYGTIDAWPQPVKNAAGYGGFDGELQQGLYQSSGVNFTPNKTYVCNVNPIQCKPGDSVKLKMKRTCRYLGIIAYKNDGTYISNSSNANVLEVTKTVPEDTAYVNINICLEEDVEITPADVGEVEVLINDGYPVEFEVRGSNLFDISKVVSSVEVTNNGDSLHIKTTPDNSAASADIPNKLKDYAPGLVVGETYTLFASTTGNEKHIYLAGNVKKHWYFGTPETVTQDMLDATVHWYASGVSMEADVSNIRIVQGKSEIPWEPYHSRTVRLLAPRPLTKWDRLEKRDGKWGWNFGGKVLEFDGSEVWYGGIWGDDSGKTYGFYRYIDGSNNSTVNVPADITKLKEQKCNYFPKNGVPYSTKSITFEVGSSYVSIRLDAGIFSNTENLVEQWKEILSDWKEKGSPLTVSYAQKTPEWVELSTEEQTAMKALETYYPTTVIQNSVNAQMRLQYVADPDHYLEQHYQAKLDTIDTLAERVAALETNTIKEV